MDLRARQILEFWFADTVRRPAAIPERIAFWFGEEGEARAAAVERDEFIRTRFRPVVEKASEGDLSHWADDASERLALVIVLDQFRRNIYRGTADTFARDGMALELTRSGVRSGLDRALAPIERAFFLMPLQHAESLAVQEESVRAFEALEAEAPAEARESFQGFTKYARLHLAIVRRFGRFPHRNAILGRPATAEEVQYLTGDAPRFGQ